MSLSEQLNPNFKVSTGQENREIGRIGDEFYVRFPIREFDTAKHVKVISGSRPNAQKQWWIVPGCLPNVEPILKLIYDLEFFISADAILLLEEISKLPLDKIQSSYATDADVQVTGLAHTLRAFQRAGVVYASKADRCFIADEMGLGKTIQAIATVQYKNAFPCLVVCPASLKLNWIKEWDTWVPTRRAGLVSKNLNWFDTEVFVVNYDVLAKYVEELRGWNFSSVICDESHLIKNPNAIRTQAVLRVSERAPVRLLLSGTPILNRPSELESQLRVLGRLEDIPLSSLNVSGNDPREQDAKLKMLNEKLRATCFIRRNKAEVLTELPAKQRTIIPIELNNRAEYNLAKTDLVQWLRKQFVAPVLFKRQFTEQLVRIGALKRLAAQGKLQAAIEWIENFLESGEKLVVFAHHHNIINALLKKFPRAVAIHGDMENVDRQVSVEKFQKDPDCKLIICSLMAAGVGHTLTAASNVAFLELGWHSGIHDQAEDRCHRIGQLNLVTAWYLLGSNTIDEWNWSLIESKRAMSKAVIEGQGSGSFNEDMIPEEFLQQLIEESGENN